MKRALRMLSGFLLMASYAAVGEAQGIYSTVGGASAAVAVAEPLDATQPMPQQQVSTIRFTDNGNGTITDNNTGLIWVKDPSAAGVGGTYTWSSAISACENLVYAGYSDWRLPNRNELQSLVDYSRYGPAIDPMFVCQSSRYWSSSVSASYSDDAWYVYFSNGSVDWGYKYDGYYYVRPVRGGP